MATVITAAQARGGDVVLAADGDVYQAPGAGGAGGWSKMQLIGFYGDPAATAPDGDLILLARDGRPHHG
jgi:hypothetical protein